MKNIIAGMEKGTRIDVADVLRGFAVMGIVMLHCIEHFNFYSFPEVGSDYLRFTDKVIWDSMFFAFGGKAYAIFALLFGLSFFIQDDKQTQQGKDFRPRFMWRLVLLFVIGNINAMFFTAEILVLYSIIGFTLIPVCRLKTRTVMWIAFILILQPMEWGKIFYALCHPEYIPGAELSAYYFERAFVVQRDGNFLETIKMNLWDGQLASLSWAWKNGRFFQTASLFMVGMIIGRTRLFVYSEKNLKFWFSALILSLVAYFPLTGLHDLLPDFIENKALTEPLGLIVKSWANFSFMLIWVSGIILLFYTTRLKTVFMRLAPYGRMSLTNYVSQSIIGSMLFYGWGLALHQYLGITYSFIVGFCLFLLQYTFCTWWLKSHKQGVLEGLWKKATWLKISKCN